MFCLNIFAQEDNCPEPKKKAVKIVDLAKTASFDKKKALLFEAIKIDPNFLEAYDELAEMSEKKSDAAFNAGNISEFKQQERLKFSYWKKIVEICPDYRNFYFPMQLGDYYFGKRQFIAAKPYYQEILSSPKAYKKD